ncbi:kelch repeat-containing protein [Myxococcus hansupus]|uniref:kelch repeat-containing protein n=1 Tax=Pseudomyxococcus hansupus TaxID=1297742 RepID=UPI0002F2BD1D|nr:kelch repeat-containing protein [Myxococcus hansupus]
MKRIAPRLSLLTLLVCAACGPEAVDAPSFQPQTQTSALAAPRWDATTPALTARSGAIATRLPSGAVLVTGGTTTSGPLSTTELYHPATATWPPTTAMSSRRSGHDQCGHL